MIITDISWNIVVGIRRVKFTTRMWHCAEGSVLLLRMRCISEKSTNVVFWRNKLGCYMKRWVA